MLVKFVLINSMGGVLDHAYARMTPDLGGFVDLRSNDLPAWTLSHGDTLKIEFVDQLDPVERTDEDERELGKV